MRPETTDPKVRPSTLLVVDDEQRNRALLRGYLDRDHVVLEAASAAEAFDVLAREKIDLVLLDVMMPGVSGFDVCRRIKSEAAGHFLPVLLLTALSEQDDRNAGLEAGADDFLSKPIDRRELLLRVALFLRLRQQEEIIARQLAELRDVRELEDDLAAIIVHDLRNPLAGVLGLLEVLQDEVTDLTHKEDLHLALQNARSMRGALDDMLQVRLQEEGVLALLLEDRPILPIVRDAVASIVGDAKLRSVQITVDGPDDVTARVDRKLVRRAVENLAANALKYSRRGSGVDVTVGVTAGGTFIDVADRGPGIPDEFKKTLFTKFGSVEAQKGNARRGVGLGLYSAKLAAAAHGGQVSARDRDGGGTIFRILLPSGSA